MGDPVNEADAFRRADEALKALLLTKPLPSITCRRGRQDIIDAVFIAAPPAPAPVIGELVAGPVVKEGYLWAAVVQNKAGDTVHVVYAPDEAEAIRLRDTVVATQTAPVIGELEARLRNQIERTIATGGRDPIDPNDVEALLELRCPAPVIGSGEGREAMARRDNFARTIAQHVSVAFVDGRHVPLVDGIEAAADAIAALTPPAPAVPAELVGDDWRETVNADEPVMGSPAEAERELVECWRRWTEATGPAMGTRKQLNAREAQEREARSRLAYAGGKLAWHLSRRSLIASQAGGGAE